MVVTKRDRRIIDHLGLYRASPFKVLWDEFWPGCTRSTPETRLNQLCREELIGKDTHPLLYYYLRPKGAELLKNGPPPPPICLRGDFGQDLARHIVISIFCSRNKYQLIRQCDAVQLGKWCEHADLSQTYFRDGSTVYSLSVNTTMRPRDVIERCLEDGRARRKKHGSRFYDRLKTGQYRWCIITPSKTKGQAIHAAAQRMGFPAQGVSPKHSLKVVWMSELLELLPQQKTPKPEKKSA